MKKIFKIILVLAVVSFLLLALIAPLLLHGQISSKSSGAAVAQSLSNTSVSSSNLVIASSTGTSSLKIVIASSTATSTATSSKPVKPSFAASLKKSDKKLPPVKIIKKKFVPFAL